MTEYAEAFARVISALDDLDSIVSRDLSHPPSIFQTPDPSSRASQRGGLRKQKDDHHTREISWQALTSRISHHQDQLSKVVHQYDTALAPILMIPPELLSEIFDWTLNMPNCWVSREMRRSSLNAVCRQWRNIVSRQCSLWAEVEFPIGDLAIARSRCSKSGSLPISVTITTISVGVDNVSAGQLLAGLLDKSNLPWLGRIAELTWHGHAPLCGHLTTRLITVTELPLLRSLEFKLSFGEHCECLVCRPLSNHVEFYESNIPVLEDLRLSHLVLSPRDAYPEFINLKKLTLTGVSAITWSSLKSILCGSTLTYLHLSGIATQVSRSVLKQSRQQAVSQPLLKQMVLDSVGIDLMLAVLGSVKFPSLTSLELTMASETHNLTQAQGRMLVTTLQTAVSTYLHKLSPKHWLIKILQFRRASRLYLLSLDWTPKKLRYFFQALQTTVSQDSSADASVHHLLKALKVLKLSFEQAEALPHDDETADVYPELLIMLQSRKDAASVHKLKALAVPSCIHSEELVSFAQTVKATECYTCMEREDEEEYDDESELDPYGYGYDDFY